MNKRINEEFLHVSALAPQSVAANTAKTGEWLDVSGVMEVEFVATSAALGEGRILMVELLAATTKEGTNPEVIASKTFVDDVGTSPVTVAVSYRPTDYHGRYVAVRLTHDAAAAVLCSVVAAARMTCLPAENTWALNT